MPLACHRRTGIVRTQRSEQSGSNFVQSSKPAATRPRVGGPSLNRGALVSGPHITRTSSSAPSHRPQASSGRARSHPRRSSSPRNSRRLRSECLRTTRVQSTPSAADEAINAFRRGKRQRRAGREKFALRTAPPPGSIDCARDDVGGERSR